MSKFSKKTKKYFEFIYTKIKLLFKQKKFYSSGTRLKYMFENNKFSNTLIVVFSACTRKGIKARYNYVKSLKEINANKLFILDDFAKDKRGCYYLGEYPRLNVEKATEEIIKNFLTIIKADKVIFCGSSKGGWSAINFGLKDYNIIDKYVICGAPQYNLGTYIKFFDDTFAFLKGNSQADEVIEFLDNYLSSQIKNCKNNKPKIYIHYSDKEHTYNDHIKYLLCDLRKFQFEINEDKSDYTDHNDVALYFPKYLKESINNIVKK